MFKTISRLLFFWSLILVIFFLIGETCFRLLRKEDNTLARIVQTEQTRLFKPNKSVHLTSSKKGEFSYTAHINCYGYRGKDFLSPKPKGMLRIFAVGDSFTFGFGSEDHQTIPYLIEVQLRKKNILAEVVNAGIGNSSPIQHYVNLKNIHLKYQPDIVILFFDLTDMWDDWHFEQTAIRNKEGEIVRFDPLFVNGKRDWWKTLMSYSAFARFVDQKIVRSYKKIQVLGFKRYFQAVREGKRAKALIATSGDSKIRNTSIEYDGLIMMRGREKKNLIDQNWGRTAEYLKKIKDLLDKEKIPLLIVLYPHGIYVGEDQWSQGRLLWGFEANKRYTDLYGFEIVEDFARRHDIPLINTLEDFLKAPHQKYFFDWDGHMTSAGNQIVVQSVVRNKIFADLLDKVLSEEVLDH